jgi:hypothetical protein
MTILRLTQRGQDAEGTGERQSEWLKKRLDIDSRRIRSLLSSRKILLVKGTWSRGVECDYGPYVALPSRLDPMSHWIWRDDMSSEHQASLGTRPPLIQARGLRFGAGILVVNPALGAPVDIALSGDDDGLLMDNLVALGLPGLLVSSRLRATFEEGGADSIQHFPLDLTTSNCNTLPHQHFIANIVGRASDRSTRNLVAPGRSDG